MIKVRVLAKKCDVKWLTLKINLTIQCIFKKMKNVSMDKKMISPHNEWSIENIMVCAHFSSKLAHGTYCLCSITQLFRLLAIV